MLKKKLKWNFWAENSIFVSEEKKVLGKDRKR